MTRDEAIEYLKKIPEDEPVFVLRAQDRAAPVTVAGWAILAQYAGSPREKYRGATDQADAMVQWQKENPDKVKVPD